jgi:hypothetical protein
VKRRENGDFLITSAFDHQSLITNGANMGVSSCTWRPMVVQIADARWGKKLIAGRPTVPDIRGRRPVRPHTRMVDPLTETQARRSIDGSEMPNAPPRNACASIAHNIAAPTITADKIAAHLGIKASITNCQLKLTCSLVAGIKGSKSVEDSGRRAKPHATP